MRKIITAGAPGIEECLAAPPCWRGDVSTTMPNIEPLLPHSGLLYPPLSVHPLHEAKHQKENNKLSGSEWQRT
jgi:hypothetical protein